jgi:hypothetical protein
MHSIVCLFTILDFVDMLLILMLHPKSSLNARGSSIVLTATFENHPRVGVINHEG